MTTALRKDFVSDTSCGGSYGAGWQLTFASFLPLLAVTVIFTVIQGVFETTGGSSDEDESAGFIMIGTLFGIFLAGPIQMCARWVFLKAARRDSFRITDVFSGLARNYWNAVAAGVLVGLSIVIGLVLFIVPGIIIACRLAFVDYLIIDRKMGAIEAMQKSWDMTRGHGWTIFLMGLLAIPVVILGLLALLVGVFVSIMWVESAYAVLFHTVSLNEGYSNEDPPMLAEGERSPSEESPQI